MSRQKTRSKVRVNTHILYNNLDKDIIKIVIIFINQAELDRIFFSAPKKKKIKNIQYVLGTLRICTAEENSLKRATTYVIELDFKC